MGKKSLNWYLCEKESDFRRAKRALSEKLLGVPIRGSSMRMTNCDPELANNLVGVGVCEKISGSTRQGIPSVTFYVRQKQPKSLLTRRLLLPKTFEGMDCDVVPCGEIYPAQAGSPRSRLDPLTPGAQIQVEGCGSGTLGAFVVDADGDTCLISNCHVLSRFRMNGEGAEVHQPRIVQSGSRAIASVKTVIPIQADGKNRVDVALAKLHPNVNFTTAIPGIGQISGSKRPKEMDPVAKFGQVTELTRSEFDSIDVDVRVNFGITSAVFANVYVFYRSTFADEGDSGSAVVDERDKSVIGLIFATSESRNFAIPAKEIESRLGGIRWL